MLCVFSFCLLGVPTNFPKLQMAANFRQGAQLIVLAIYVLCGAEPTCCIGWIGWHCG